MRPYVVINGKSSKEINGLIIQTLPPITKPQMRTEVEEIDGRDGEVVNTLGYSAYDRVILIGLTANANVDDVISFFNTSGTAVFSNEPDKTYRFSCYEQIDFEKLLRFKQATVTLRVEPFKTNAEEVPIIENPSGEAFAEIKIRNIGNVYAKPTIAIKNVMTNNVVLYLNGEEVFSIVGVINKDIIIDVANYSTVDQDGNNLNRYTTGDYEDLNIPAGINTLKIYNRSIITGAITVEISNYTRWI